MKQKGFTIVEIIITVTVIGILAAIAIVGYSGITQRANNAQTVEAVRQWAEAFESADAEHSGDWNISIPKGSNAGESTMVCLGENYPHGYSGQGGTGQCIGSDDGFGIDESADLNNIMKEYFDGGIPTPSFQATKVSGDENNMWIRGIFFFGDSPYIGFIVKGVSKCPEVGTVRSHAYGSQQDLSEQIFGGIELEDDTLMCVIQFDAFS